MVGQRNSWPFCFGGGLGVMRLWTGGLGAEGGISYIRLMKLKLLIVALLLACTGYSQRTLLYCGSLIDPKSGKVLTEVSVIVTGGVIAAVEKGYVAAAAGDKTIDL